MTTRRKFTPARRRTIAYHEAGHAVAQIDLGAPFEKVVIYERPIDDTGGMVHNSPDHHRLLDHHHHVVIRLAGPFAHIRYQGRPRSIVSNLLTYGRDDYLMVIGFAKAIEDATEVPITASVAIGLLEAERLIDRRWDDIELVAQALVECGTLSYQEVLEIVTIKEPIGIEIVRQGFASGIQEYNEAMKKRRKRSRRRDLSNLPQLLLQLLVPVP